MVDLDYAAAPSPSFVLDEARLRANLERLAEVQSRSGATVLCALKGFAFYGSFALVRQYLSGVTASSLHEARLGQEKFCTTKGKAEIHAYCPAYIPADLTAIASIASHLTFNSLSEFHRHRAALTTHCSPGLRINPEYAEVETDLYNPCIRGSRLGVTADRLRQGQTLVLPKGIEGLHFHSLCEKGADTLARTLDVIEERFFPLLDQIRWLNLGGGHAITRAGYDLDHLVRLVAGLRTRHPQLESIILEPGSAVGWQCGELVSTVLDIVECHGIRTAMLDVSFAAHMPDCLEMPYQPKVLGATNRSDSSNPDKADGHGYRLGGQTCLAGDCMGDYHFAHALKVGDRVVFLDMIHYTMVKTTTFNGVHLPAIVVRREQGQLEVLKTFGYDDYCRRL